ncbi:unnamed protein product [Symbiodinium sp. CCMP2456]|nr:unnamed protein product [Symbiodinium sp. CCMP2456]
MSAEAALISERQHGGGEGFVETTGENTAVLRQYFVHLDLKTFSEQEQVFDSTVATSDGEVLFKGTDVAFRKVTPEQIKKAMESQMAEDDQKIYEASGCHHEDFWRDSL